MENYFNVNFEFNHQNLEKAVQATAVQGKGYCCFIDLNSLVYSYSDLAFREVLNNSVANSCDGSYIALSASRIHNLRLKEYIGPDFFKKFIYRDKKHLIIGNTEVVFNKIKTKVALANGHSDNLNYLAVPFLSVEDFDYDKIGAFVNVHNPDYIWVSLGAPKQEFFMHYLLPHIKRGMMLGVGAATNYFTGEVRDIPAWIKKAHLIWVFRIFTEPKKQLKRCKQIALVFPKLYREEKLRVLNNKIT